MFVDEVKFKSAQPLNKIDVRSYQVYMIQFIFMLDFIFWSPHTCEGPVQFPLLLTCFFLHIHQPSLHSIRDESESVKIKQTLYLQSVINKYFVSFHPNVMTTEM